MAVKFANNASSTLSSSISDIDTSLTLADASAFPALSGDEWFPLTVVNGSGDVEIMRVTARASDTLTVERGQEGTTAVAFALGAKCELRLTAASLNDLAPSGGGGGGGDSAVYTTTIGNGVSDEFLVTHNLGTQDVVVVVRANNPISGFGSFDRFTRVLGGFESRVPDSFYRISIGRQPLYDTDNQIGLASLGIEDAFLETFTALPANSIIVTVIDRRANAIDFDVYEATMDDVAEAHAGARTLNERITAVAAYASPNAGAFLVGAYYDNSFHAGALTTLAGAANRVEMAPFVSAVPLIIDQLGIAVSAAAASSQLKCFIYSSDENGWPDELLYEGDTNLDGSTTGYKWHSLQFRFEAGKRYWVGVRCSSTASYRAIPLASALSLGLSGSNATSYFTVIRRTLTYGTALPASWGFTSSDLVAGITPPSIRMRGA